MSAYEYRDWAGDVLGIRPSEGDPRPGAAIEINDGDVAILPPHEIPGAARALYAAAGLPVPELPDIPDPATVTELAIALMGGIVARGISGASPVTTAEDLARDLLSLGWRKGATR